MVEVESIAPHQYRQQERTVGEKYLMDEVHVRLFELMNYVRRGFGPVVAERDRVPEVKPKTRRR